MRTRRSVFVALASLLAAAGMSAHAQRPAAALVLAEGSVSVNDRVVDAIGAQAVLPDGAVVRVTQGRAAIALKQGGWLFLDTAATVRVLANGYFTFNRLEILHGSAIVVSETSAPLVNCDNEIRLSDAGFFRFDAHPVNARGERPCQFRVYEGAAAVQLASVTSALRAGQAMMCNRRCGDMIGTTEFSRTQLDEFDQWVRQAHDRIRP